MFKNAFLFVCAASALLVIGCNKPASADSGKTPADSTALPSIAADPAPTASQAADSATLMKLAKEVLQAAADKDYGKFADHVHPRLGVRFSPYAFIDVESDLVFLPQAFRDQVAQTKKKITWGTYDPRDEDIHTTVDGYFKEFVADKPYLAQGQWAFNETIGSSTVVNNLTGIYPQAKFVEAFWAPEDEEKAPYEWGSVRLVFEKEGDRWYVVGVVHDAWNT